MYSAVWVLVNSICRQVDNQEQPSYLSFREAVCQLDEQTSGCKALLHALLSQYVPLLNIQVWNLFLWISFILVHWKKRRFCHVPYFQVNVPDVRAKGKDWGSQLQLPVTERKWVKPLQAYHSSLTPSLPMSPQAAPCCIVPASGTTQIISLLRLGVIVRVAFITTWKPSPCWVREWLCGEACRIKYLFQ